MTTVFRNLLLPGRLYNTNPAKLAPVHPPRACGEVDTTENRPANKNTDAASAQPSPLTSDKLRRKTTRGTAHSAPMGTAFVSFYGATLCARAPRAGPGRVGLADLLLGFSADAAGGGGGGLVRPRVSGAAAATDRSIAGRNEAQFLFSKRRIIM